MNYKKLHEDTMMQCERYVEAFCEIMDYNPRDVDFVGNDPFGIVGIADDFWNMTDIFYVISEYDKWKEKYGDELQHVISKWYWWSLEEYEKARHKPCNLHHWLMGWRPDLESTDEYNAQREKERKEAAERVKKAQEHVDKIIEEELSKVKGIF